MAPPRVQTHCTLLTGSWPERASRDCAWVSRAFAGGPGIWGCPASWRRAQGSLTVIVSPPPPTGDRLRQTENRATRCKVERLQLLLQQKRLRRKARRDARGPYHWPPSRKAGRSDSSGGGGGGGPSEAAGLGLDFEDSVWKPEVNPDIKSEFVVA